MKMNILPALSLTILSCNQQKIDTKTEVEKVVQTSKKWAQIAATKDVEKTLSY
jgi:hypothetical protein